MSKFLDENGLQLYNDKIKERFDAINNHRLNVRALNKGATALGVDTSTTSNNGEYDYKVEVIKGYDAATSSEIRTYYNTAEKGSGSTDDHSAVETPTEELYYNDDTTQHLSNYSITFATTGAHGLGSVSEGYHNLAFGDYSHTEGVNNYAPGSASHAEGSLNITLGSDSHAEGLRNTAIGQASHTEGVRNTSGCKGSHTEGLKNQTGERATWSHVEGEGNLIKGHASHGEGGGNVIYDDIEEITNEDGTITLKNNIAWSHVEGYGNQVRATKAHAEGQNNEVSGESGHAEGKSNNVIGKYAHAEGFENIAKGNNSHAEGTGTQAIGATSHTEGTKTTVAGQSAHAEGHSSNKVDPAIAASAKADIVAAFNTAKFTVATGLGAHAEGYNTIALASGAHSEGKETIAQGDMSHAEGYRTQANAKYSHAEGWGTIANGNYSHVSGQYNIPASSGFATIIGNGTSSAPNNAFTLSWKGEGRFAGEVYSNSTWDQTNGKVITGDRLIKESEIIRSENNPETYLAGINDTDSYNWNVTDTTTRKANSLALTNAYFGKDSFENTDGGHFAAKLGNNSQVVGYNSVAYNGLALGNYNIVTTPTGLGVAIGKYNKVVYNSAGDAANDAVALGSYNTASRWAATAIGYKNTSNGSQALTVGAENNISKGNQSLSIGFKNNVSHNRCIVIGQGHTTTGDNQILLGTYPAGTNYNDTLVIGNGTADAPNSLLELRDSGALVLGGAAPDVVIPGLAGSATNSVKYLLDWLYGVLTQQVGLGDYGMPDLQARVTSLETKINSESASYETLLAGYGTYDNSLTVGYNRLCIVWRVTDTTSHGISNMFFTRRDASFTLKDESRDIHLEVQGNTVYNIGNSAVSIRAI